MRKPHNNFKKIRGVCNVDNEFDDIVSASESSKLVQHPWLSLLKRKYRPQLAFAILMPALQQLTGMNVITFYAPVLFKTIGFQNDASPMSVLITVIVNYCIAILVSIFTVDRVGRRKLFLEGGIQMFIFQVIISLIYLKFTPNFTKRDYDINFLSNSNLHEILPQVATLKKLDDKNCIILEKGHR